MQQSVGRHAPDWSRAQLSRHKFSRSLHIQTYVHGLLIFSWSRGSRVSSPRCQCILSCCVLCCSEVRTLDELLRALVALPGGDAGLLDDGLPLAGGVHAAAATGSALRPMAAANCMYAAGAGGNRKQVA